jgi:hypothetical protein
MILEMALLETTTPGLVAGAAKAFLAMPHNRARSQFGEAAPQPAKKAKSSQNPF